MKARLFRCLIWIGCVLAAPAHPILQDAMWIQFEPSLMRVAVNVSLKEICVAQNLPAGSTTNLEPAILNRALEQHGEYVLKHLTFSVGPNILAGTGIKLTYPPALAEPEETFYQFELEYPLSRPPPGEVTIINEMLKEHSYAAGTAWDVSYVVRAKRAGDEAATTWLLGCQKPAIIPTGLEISARLSEAVAQPQSWRTFCEFFWHGGRHILTGWDHLLFISALVIATRTFWAMVKVIAAFTFAHTLTLALCVFGIFRLPAFIVEPVIALSILFVALENLLWPARARSRIRLAVAFGFGLIHGLGFAGGLLDAMAGLPAIGTWIALGAFSLGVEAGHQLVVLPLFGLLALSRYKMSDQGRAALLRYSASAISVCGAYYLFVAVHEQFFTR